MTENRFKATYEDGYCVCDEETDLLYHMDNDMITKEMSNLLNQLNNENEQLKQQVQNIHKLINSKIQSARELGNVRTVIALKNLQRELKGDLND